MKKIISAGIMLLFIACQQPVTQQDLAKLNGYWEIKEVNAPDADKKEYAINDTFEYFEVKENTGLRKKMKPQFDGTFIDNANSESFVVKFDDGKMYLHYATPYAKWTEEVTELSDSLLVVVNEQKIEFRYKRAGAINLLGDGEKIK